MTTPMPVYNRAPSQELRDLLLPGAFLAPLVELAGLQVSGHCHDVHFRRNDEVHVYRGRTAVLRIRRYRRVGDLNITANKKYTKTSCPERIFGRWTLNDTGFEEALFDHLSKVDVSGSFSLKEGDIQQRWSRVSQPWIPFDREGRLGGSHNKGADFPAIREALSRLKELSRDTDWTVPKVKGEKIDQLAIDPQGRLVLLELKDGSKTNAEIYYSPFQLLQYVWEWHDALGAVRNNLQKVIDARIAVGLTPPSVPLLTGGIRACVGFGAALPKGDTKPRYDMVLEVVNRHLPDNVAPIETWACTDTGPTLVA